MPPPPLRRPGPGAGGHRSAERRLGIINVVGLAEGNNGAIARHGVSLLREVRAGFVTHPDTPPSPRHPVPGIARYNRRALAEAAIGRFKRVIGDALRSRTDRRQATEVAIAVDVLNRMLRLGRPESVRVA
jgi:hypothetical protein